MTKTATVRPTGHGRFYLSHGATRSKREWRTAKGAARWAVKIGYTVVPETVDVMRLYERGVKTKIVRNLMSDKLVRIAANTPLALDPSSETYWSA